MNRLLVGAAETAAVIAVAEMVIVSADNVVLVGRGGPVIDQNYCRRLMRVGIRQLSRERRQLADRVFLIGERLFLVVIVGTAAQNQDDSAFDIEIGVVVILGIFRSDAVAD